MADKPYMGLRQLDTAGKLAEKRRELDALRQKDKQDWALNRAFYRGDQWSFYLNGEVRTLGTDEANKPSYRVRLTDNRILPGCMSYIAQLTKTKPVINATPDTSSDRDIKAAQLGEKLYTTWWTDFKMKSKLASVLLNTLLDQGYWSITWDPSAAASMTVMVNPETGQPITDDDLAEAFRDELQQQGVDPSQFEQTVYLGDIKVDVMSGENVWLDPAAKTFDDAKYAICKHPMDPDEVKARWPKAGDVSANSSPSSDAVLLIGQKFDGERPRTLRDVFIMYVRPHAAVPKGRYVVWIEGDEKVLADDPWPFPFDELPLIKFPGVERPDSPLDESLVTHVRPLQKDVNRTRSQIVQHKNLTLKPQMVAPIGSLRQRITDEPGAVLEYTPIGGMAPEWRQIPSLPPYVFEHLQDTIRAIDQKFNSAAISRGDVPPNVEAGIAIDLLQEAAVDQVAPTIQRLEEALAAAGMLMVKLAQEFYIEPRLLKIWGPGGAVRVKKFKAADLKGGFSFHAEAGSGIPRTRAGRQARIEFLLDRQLISPGQALKHLDVADLGGVLTPMVADEDMAQREHQKLLEGQPLNMMAYNGAIQMLQQGINPETQQPLDGSEDVNGIVEHASVTPLPYEDHEVHIKEHRLWMTSLEFESYPPDAQQRAVMHFQMTQQAQAAAQAPAEQQPVRANLSLSGTVGPTAAAEILRRTGVEVTPEQMMEPPLETSVYDSMDKPDADSAGNDPLDDAEKLMSMQQSAQAHDAQMAKSAADLALAEKRHAQSDFSPKTPAGK